MNTGKLTAFQVQGCLGSGGFSTVYRALRLKCGTSCALKIANDARPRTILRFRRETWALQRLGQGFAPAWIEDGLLPDGRPYVAMEELEGQSLSAWLSAPEPDSPHCVLEIAASLVKALWVCHEQGIVHGDLKPGNIWLDSKTNSLKLLDFGLCRPCEGDEQISLGPGLLGTPVYMAPELFASDLCSGPRGDIYAFGVIFYELLVGRPPFEGSLQQLGQAHRLYYPPALPSSLPKDLKLLIQACMRKRPQERPLQWPWLLSVIEQSRALLPHLPRPLRPASSSLEPYATSADPELPGFSIPEPAANLDEDPPLGGRDTEVRLLERAISEAGTQKRSLFILLLGEEGMGKTRMLQHFVSKAPELLAGANLHWLATTSPVGEVPQAATLNGPTLLLLDDAQRAPDRLLNALDALACLDDPYLPPRIVLLASEPRLATSRPTLGKRAPQYLEILLSPLSENASKALLSELLLPADYVPDALLAQAYEHAGGCPAALVALSSALKKAGAIEQRKQKPSYYLGSFSPTFFEQAALWPWIAHIELSDLAEPLVFAVRVCAQLPTPFEWRELEHALLSLQTQRPQEHPIPDARIALNALLGAGLLLLRPDNSYAFRNPELRQAIDATLPETMQEALHRALLEYWSDAIKTGTRDEAYAWERIEAHARRAGETRIALDAIYKVIELAQRDLCHLRADAWATHALSLGLDEGHGDGRARLLLARGQARYHLHRLDEALGDLQAAEAGARLSANPKILAQVLLARATALDWAGDFKASALCADHAHGLVQTLDEACLGAQATVALGRSAWRRGDIPEALRCLEHGIRQAKSAGDEEALVIALLLYACALVNAGHVKEAGQIFERLISLCQSRGDDVHLSAAYGNRFFLWSHEGNIERGAADLGQALHHARKAGNPWPERAATFNLAELFYWLGNLEDALRLARRAVDLEERFMQTPTFEGHLLLARLRASRGEWSELRPLLHWLSLHCAHTLAGDPQVLCEALNTILAFLDAPGGSMDAAAALQSLRAYLSRLSGAWPEEKLELLLWWIQVLHQQEQRDLVYELWSLAQPLLKERPRFLALFVARGVSSPQAIPPSLK